MHKAPGTQMRQVPATSSQILVLAREFAGAAARFYDALPTGRAGGTGSVRIVIADEHPLSRKAQEELLEALSSVTWNLCHGVVYLERTAGAHRDPDAVAEALRGMHGLLAHLASTLSTTATEIAQEAGKAQNAESACRDDVRAIAENALSTAAFHAAYAPGYPASWLLLNEVDLIHAGRPLSAMESEEAEQEAYRLATRLAVATLGRALATREAREGVGETLRRAAAQLKP
jgi:hypothetical protein